MIPLPPRIPQIDLFNAHRPLMQIGAGIVQKQIHMYIYTRRYTGKINVFTVCLILQSSLTIASMRLTIVESLGKLDIFRSMHVGQMI